MTVVAYRTRFLPVKLSAYVLCNAGQVERARKRQCKARQELAQTPVKSHLRSASTPPKRKEIKHTHQPACFFCDETTGDFHKAETISLDNRVRHIATELRDTKLFAKLSVGDMIAIDAVYHFKCLTSFYNKHRFQGRHSASFAVNIAFMLPSTGQWNFELYRST